MWQRSNTDWDIKRCLWESTRFVSPSHMQFLLLKVLHGWGSLARHLTLKAQVRAPSSPCEICDGQRGTSVFPCENRPHLLCSVYRCTTLVWRTRGRNLGSVKRRNSLTEMEKIVQGSCLSYKSVVNTDVQTVAMKATAFTQVQKYCRSKLKCFMSSECTCIMHIGYWLRVSKCVV